MSARLLVAMAIVAYTASAIKHKLETQQEKYRLSRREARAIMSGLIDRAAIAQIGKSKLVYYLIFFGSGDMIKARQTACCAVPAQKASSRPESA